MKFVYYTWRTVIWKYHKWIVIKLLHRFNWTYSSPRSATERLPNFTSYIFRLTSPTLITLIKWSTFPPLHLVLHPASNCTLQGLMLVGWLPLMFVKLTHSGLPIFIYSMYWIFFFNFSLFIIVQHSFFFHSLFLKFNVLFQKSYRNILMLFRKK